MVWSTCSLVHRPVWGFLVPWGTIPLRRRVDTPSCESEDRSHSRSWRGIVPGLWDTVVVVLSVQSVGTTGTTGAAIFVSCLDVGLRGALADPRFIPARMNRQQQARLEDRSSPDRWVMNPHSEPAHMCRVLPVLSADRILCLG